MTIQILRFCLCVLISISVIPNVLFAASFDCSKASTKTEKAVCNDPILSKLDDDLAAVYSKALKVANNDIVKKKQRKWLKEILAPCQEDNDCIKSAYENRIHELNLAVYATDTITGAYQYPLSKKYDNRYPAGFLEVLRISKDKIRFSLSCVLGEPSHNLGDADGVATLEKDHAFFKDGDCEITFIFKKNLVEVEVNKPWACGFGNNVSCEGIYKIKSRKLKELKLDEE